MFSLSRSIFSKITTVIADIITGFTWVFLKICVYLYRFIKYVWYGLLWPFVLIVIAISKLIIKSREVDVDKLKKESQRIY